MRTKAAEPMYIRHNRTDISGAFSDPRLFLVPLDDSRIMGRTDSQVHAEQLPDGPAYLAIGENATDLQLQRVVERYPVILLGDLVAFRQAMKAVRKATAA